MGQELVHVRNITPNLYMGSGQADRVIAHAHDLEVACIIFDHPLSPVHLRNWGRRSGLEVYDRHAVILDIFARRARTREAKLQVELARARYTLSHLVGMWQHLSRQGGGTHLARGEGETQLELDRRRLTTRVTRAKKALGRVAKQRELRRRRRDNLFRIALVGYTNAGKSSLMNRLTKSSLVERDQLFATLDPATRKLYLDQTHQAILSDTVGFVRRLPPELIEAFHSTLEEVVEADLLLFVVDIADSEASSCLETTREVVHRLTNGTIPSILVGNKIDLASNVTVARQTTTLLASEERWVCTSTRTGEGIDELKSQIRTYADDLLARPPENW